LKLKRFQLSLGGFHLTIIRMEKILTMR